MQATKWIIAGFVFAVAFIVVAMGAAFAIAPARDANTYYGVYDAAIKTLDPAVIGDTLGSDLAGDIFECLYNYQYGVRPYQLMPELAADMPKVSASGLIYTIELRKGIHYYDPDHAVFKDGRGPEVMARDLIYSWKRVANFYTASPLYTQVFQDRIVGLDDWFAYTKTVKEDQVDWDRPVKGLTAPDPYTLRVVLTKPYPQFTFTLAYSPTAPVCRQVVDHYGREEVARHPVGTGPYALKSTDYLEDQRLVLTANPIYRGKPDADGDAVVADGDRLPHIKRIQLDYFQEEMPVWLLFQQGLFEAEGIPKESFKQAVTDTGTLTDEMVKKGIVLRKSTDPTTFYIGFNWTDPTVGGPKNVLLRQAMSMALDRRSYIATMLNGRGAVPVGPIPPGFPMFDADEKNAYTEFDPEAAKAKLAEWLRTRGLSTPPVLTLTMPGDDTETHDEGEYFKLQMSNHLGLDIELQFRDWARFQDMVDNRQTQLAAMGWVADYPDAQDFFQLFYGKNADPGDINSTGYSNPRFDAIYATAATMPDGAPRAKLYAQMNQIIMEDCPWLLQDYPITFSLYYDWLGNVQHMDYGYGMIQQQTLDTAFRQKRLAHH